MSAHHLAEGSESCGPHCRGLLTVADTGTGVLASKGDDKGRFSGTQVGASNGAPNPEHHRKTPNAKHLHYNQQEASVVFLSMRTAVVFLFICTKRIRDNHLGEAAKEKPALLTPPVIPNPDKLRASGIVDGARRWKG